MFSTDSRDCVRFLVGDNDESLLLCFSWDNAGLGGASAQGAKGGGSAASNTGCSMSIGEYVGVGSNFRPGVDCVDMGAGLTWSSYQCIFCSGNFMRRRFSVLISGFCSRVPPDILRTASFFNVCGMADHLCFGFFSSLFLSLLISNPFRAARTGEEGDGGPTSLSSKRWYMASCSMLSPGIARGAIPEIGRE
jgi:hypothetical protein